MNKVYLGVFSKEYTANQISKKLGIDFDQEHKKGEPRGKGIKATHKENVWILDSKLDSNQTLDNHIQSIIKKIAPFKDRFKSLDKCDVICECIIKSKDSPVMFFSKSVLKELAQINADLDVDLYLVDEK